MSLIWMDGFDSYGPNFAGSGGASLIDNPAFNNLLTTSGYVSSAGARVRVGEGRVDYGKCLILGGQDPSRNQSIRLAFLPEAEIVTGFAYKFERTNLNSIVRFHFDDRLGTITEQMALWVNAEGGISATMGYDGLLPATLIGATRPNVIFPGVWQYIEVRYRPNKVSGDIIVKLDGQECFTISGVPTSRSTTPNQVNMIELIVYNSNKPLSGVNGSNWYDDWYVLNGAGSGFNDFLGDVIVHSVDIVSDQGPNELSQFGGTIGHYTSVNSIPTDEDVSYLYGNTGGAKEMFGLGELPENIIDVLAMSVHVRGRKDAPGTALIQAKARYLEHEVTGSSEALAVQYITRNLFLEQCPDGTAWTKTKAEAAVVGFGVV